MPCMEKHGKVGAGEPHEDMVKTKRQGEVFGVQAIFLTFWLGCDFSMCGPITEPRERIVYPALET